MSDSKKYYYLKLKDNFFDSEEIKVLESMENGYKYSNILLKMYLKSIKRDGLLIFNERIPYNAKMIATVTGHNVNDVKQALVLFQQLGLIETLSNGAIYMLDIQNFIGTSSSEADRVRAYRNNIEEKKKKLLDGQDVALSSGLDDSVQMYDKRTPEKELDKELDKELEDYTDIDEDFPTLEKSSAKIAIFKSEYEKRFNETYRKTRRKSFKHETINDLQLDEFIKYVKEFFDLMDNDPNKCTIEYMDKVFDRLQ